MPSVRPDATGQAGPWRMPPAGYVTALIWFLAALGIGLVATYAAFQQSRTAETMRARVQFDFAANAIVSEVVERIDAQVQALWGVVGLAAVDPDVSRDRWQAFMDSTRLLERLPGTQTVGYTKRVRPQEREAHVAAMRAQGFEGYRIWPEESARGAHDSVVVTFLKSENPGGEGVLGYDATSDPNRLVALERARDWGMPVVSGKVTLIRGSRGNPGPGFLIFLPTFRAGMPNDTVEERRAALLGYAYSAFQATDFLLSRRLSQRLVEARAALEVYDGVALDEENLLYRSSDFPSAATQAAGRVARMETIAEIVGGRTWLFRIASAGPLQASDSGMPRIVLLAGIAISLLAGAVVGALALNRAQAVAANARLRADVAQRREIEAQLRDSEAKFRRLFDNIPLPTFAIDRETLRYFAVNAAAVAKYGYSQVEFTRMNVADIRPAEDVPEAMRYLEGVRGRDGYSGEFRHKLRDGTVIDVDIAAHNIDFGGRELIIVIANDITERKRAEKALAESEQQLRQAQKLEAVGQLTGGIAHDFNNILTVITGTIEILGDAVAHDPKLAAIARLIDEAATRGADTTRDLLAFARRQPLQPRDTDINDLVAGALKLFRSSLGEHIEVEQRLAAGPPHAFVDPSQLTTALLNLALNARDAMPDGGRLLIETDTVSIDGAGAAMDPALTPGHYVLVSVSDSGAGIPPAIRDKVFEPFFTTKEVGKGTGLGLSMVYGFVKQSNGHVTIYSEEGYGTTIRLYLPHAESEESVTAVPEPPQVEGGSETILVVEDDALVRRYVVEHLRDLGYTTLVAASAAEALDIADGGAAFDLLFTDVVMPGSMNGRRLVEALAKRRPGLRFLYTSGYSEEAAKRNGRLAFGASILNKPYRRADLAQKIRRTLDSPPAAVHNEAAIKEGETA